MAREILRSDNNFGNWGEYVQLKGGSTFRAVFIDLGLSIFLEKVCYGKSKGKYSDSKIADVAPTTVHNRLHGSGTVDDAALSKKIHPSPVFVNFQKNVRQFANAVISGKMM